MLKTSLKCARFLAAKRISYVNSALWHITVRGCYFCSNLKARTELFHSADTFNPSDSATQGCWHSCSIFAENLGDEVCFKYVSSSVVPGILWGSFSLRISPGCPMVSAAFHPFTISSLLLWKSWACSPVASSHPSCQACPAPSATFWIAKTDWNQTSIDPALYFMRSFYSFIPVSPDSSPNHFTFFFFLFPSVILGPHSAVFTQHRFLHMCVTSSDTLRLHQPMKTAPVPFPPLRQQKFLPERSEELLPLTLNWFSHLVYREELRKVDENRKY